jgi:hypothetical protein
VQHAAGSRSTSYNCSLVASRACCPAVCCALQPHHTHPSEQTPLLPAAALSVSLSRHAVASHPPLPIASQLASASQLAATQAQAPTPALAAIQALAATREQAAILAQAATLALAATLAQAPIPALAATQALAATLALAATQAQAVEPLKTSRPSHPQPPSPQQLRSFHERLWQLQSRSRLALLALKLQAL